MTDLQRFAVENAAAPKTILHLLCVKHGLLADYLGGTEYHLKHDGNSNKTALGTSLEDKVIDISNWSVKDFVKKKTKAKHVTDVTDVTDDDGPILNL